ncbi:thioredoxin [Halobacteroides halobius DSM 5150]|uniref:Thioredoxin n=1 Tax=Halobacteroides halobius (strain ATCC 35273 / DSM 5150 / MD-1) TaxID=748449 RepID=L0K8R5_HALHC|nr:thioredoxin [Halobacteroides halobius]AGB41396.1 thioredoxin [Halobacteroides halobius DSM 5150]
MSKTTVEVTAEDFEEKVLNSDVPVVVDFWAPWCGPCKMIAPVLEELGAEYGDDVKIAKVMVDDNQSLAQEYQVTSIPNLVFFKDGEPVDRQVGFSSKEDLQAKIENI